MKKDKLLQKQLARLRAYLEPELSKMYYGSITPNGERIMALIRKAINMSLARYVKSL